MKRRSFLTMLGLSPLIVSAAPSPAALAECSKNADGTLWTEGYPAAQVWHDVEVLPATTIVVSADKFIVLDTKLPDGCNLISV